MTSSPPRSPNRFPGGVDPLAVARILAERPDRRDFDDLADLDAVLESWEQGLADQQYDPCFTPGALCLCPEGCGLAVWLVVTGPERGRLWHDRRCDDLHLYPLRDGDGAPLTFARWYLGWLAAAESA